MSWSRAASRAGMHLLSFVWGAVLAGSATAEPITITIDGGLTSGSIGATPLVGTDVLDLLLESRNQKPASQATAEERAAAVDELTNIYLVSKLPRAA